MWQKKQVPVYRNPKLTKEQKYTCTIQTGNIKLWYHASTKRTSIIFRFNFPCHIVKSHWITGTLFCEGKNILVRRMTFFWRYLISHDRNKWYRNKIHSLMQANPIDSIKICNQDSLGLRGNIFLGWNEMEYLIHPWRTYIY